MKWFLLTRERRAFEGRTLWLTVFDSESAAEHARDAFHAVPNSSNSKRDSWLIRGELVPRKGSGTSRILL